MSLLLDGEEGMLPGAEEETMEDLLLSGALRLNVWILSKELSSSVIFTLGPPFTLLSLFSLRWNLKFETFDRYLRSLVFK